MHNKNVFRIFAVIMYSNGFYATYDVVTNAGVSRYVPYYGRELPKLVFDFIVSHQFDRIHLGSCICFYENEVE